MHAFGSLRDAVGGIARSPLTVPLAYAFLAAFAVLFVVVQFFALFLGFIPLIGTAIQAGITSFVLLLAVFGAFVGLGRAAVDADSDAFDSMSEAVEASVKPYAIVAGAYGVVAAVGNVLLLVFYYGSIVTGALVQDAESAASFVTGLSAVLLVAMGLFALLSVLFVVTFQFFDAAVVLDGADALQSFKDSLGVWTDAPLEAAGHTAVRLGVHVVGWGLPVLATALLYLGGFSDPLTLASVYVVGSVVVTPAAVFLDSANHVAFYERVSDCGFYPPSDEDATGAARERDGRERERTAGRRPGRAVGDGRADRDRRPAENEAGRRGGSGRRYDRARSPDDGEDRGERDRSGPERRTGRRDERR